MPTIPVLIPLLNPNEPEALLAEIRIQNGQRVQIGEVLCTLETTKSTAEVTAEASGFIIGLAVGAGQTVNAGQVLCYLAEAPDAQPPIETPTAAPAQYSSTMPDGLRITQPALILAQSLGIDLGQFPPGKLVTEAIVRERQRTGQSHFDQSAIETPPTEFDPAAILIYGGGGHGKTVIDLVRSLGVYHIIGIVDDGLAVNDLVMGLPVLGGSDALPGLYQQGVRLGLNAVGGIGNLAVRLKVAQRLAQAGFVAPAIAHPSAVIEASAWIAAGVQVFAHAYVGSEVSVGNGVIINTGAIISHECKLGDYANISPGAILAGQVEVGPGALVGMSATINLQVKIGANARIGNGATVKSDVPEGAIVRAGSVWPA
jgi:acetyltransferase EpsM